MTDQLGRPEPPAEVFSVATSRKRLQEAAIWPVVDGGSLGVDCGYAVNRCDVRGRDVTLDDSRERFQPDIVIRQAQSELEMTSQ